MDKDLTPPAEKLRQAPSEEQLTLTRERLSASELAPQEMFEYARDILNGAEAWGTGQPIEAGVAKVFIPTEGDRKLLSEAPDAKKDYLGTLVVQVLKIHQKGQSALDARETGSVVASKAGKLSEEDKSRLEKAKRGTVDTLLARLSAYEAGYEYNQVQEADIQAVVNWVGCDADGAEQIIRDLTTRIIHAAHPGEDGEA